jgi:hypothetical protein
MSETTLVIVFLATLSACARSGVPIESTGTAPVAAPRTSAVPASASSTESAIISPPRNVVATFHLSPFYKKYVDVDGMPIVASERVSDYALLEARFLVRKMIGDRPDILRAIAANNVRLVVMAPSEMTTDIPEHADLEPKAYWNRRARGLGATTARPAVSAAEENLLDLPGDPYAAENILIHEFAHTIHERGLVTIDPTFDARLSAAYAHARQKKLWEGTYAAENRMEYWAEATQSWFDCNRVNDSAHGPIDTREKLKPYDPEMAALLKEIYGDKPWRYTKPNRRPAEERVHLTGFDVAREGRFEWPPSAPPIEKASVSLDWLAPAKVPSASPASTATTSITFFNRRAEDVTVAWLAFDGQKKVYGTVGPNASFVQQTFAGHVWIVSNAAGTIGAVAATDHPACIEVR